MNILIAPDSFKHSLSSTEVTEIISKACKDELPDCQLELAPLSDGGEGFSSCLENSIGAESINCIATDPIGRQIKTTYKLNSQSKTAIIEIAAATGIELVKNQDRNLMQSSSYGTGELILDAIKKGANKIILGLGGSATVDAGIGILNALGVQFIDKKGVLLETIPANFDRIFSVKKDFLMIDPVKIKLEVAFDVNNLLLGEKGAAKVFAPQKGANSQDILELEKGLEHFANIVNRDKQIKIDKVPGSGAAGGAIVGLSYLFENISYRNGFDIISGYINLEDKVKWADLILTGEGMIDYQTTFGKAPYGLLQLAKKHNKPVHAFCGIYESCNIPHDIWFDGVWEIRNPQKTIAYSIENAKNLLERTCLSFFKKITSLQNCI